MSKRNAKKKPTRAEQHAAAMVKFGIVKEARASVSLDGSTQSCDACQREYVTVRLDGKRLDEVVGFGRFHLEDNGGSWFLDLGGLTMNLTSRKAVPIDATSFEAGTVFQPEKKHTCGLRPITAAEMELVEAAQSLLDDVGEEGNVHNIRWFNQKNKAVRAERKEGR